MNLERTDEPKYNIVITDKAPVDSFDCNSLIRLKDDLTGTEVPMTLQVYGISFSY